jgi:sigma-B regulation protein RsbU (phosphoserine phosphatase)
VSLRELRDALARLAGEGLLTSEVGAGFRVAAVSPQRRRALAERRALDPLRSDETWVRELELAREVQRRLLPPPLLEGDGYSVSSRSLPARVVTGDFHDVIRFPDGSIAVVVADVVGKGVGASLITASVKAMTPFVAEGRDVADTLCELNRRLFAELGRGRFVALAYARLDPGSATVELANAGMPDPWLVGDGRVTSLEVAGPRLPLGVRPDLRYVAATRRLAEGERLLLYSDGIPEAPLRDGGTLGYEGFAEIVARTPRRRGNADGWLDAVLERVERVAASTLEDDWTAVAIEARPPGAP